MKSFTYYAPTRVCFGKDAADKTGRFVLDEGAGRVMILYGGGSAVKSGLIGRVEASLKEAGVDCMTLGGVKPNPTLAFAEDAVKAALDFGADLILPVGGGSVIDTAKAVAHGVANPGTALWDIWSGKAALTRSTPVGVVLTIPAAGSEMSDSAVLTNEALGLKAGLSTDLNRCRFAVMDPSCAATVPPYLMAAGIADIMMHTMERYFIPDSEAALTDEIAEGLLRTVIRCGRQILADPSDEAAMGEVMWASSLSHNGLTNCGRDKDFSIHKFGHALSAAYDSTHGATLTCIWPAWAAYQYDGALSRFARFARQVWGVDEADDKKAALKGIDMTSAYFHEIGMPLTIAELGFEPSDEDLHRFALNATKNDTVVLSKIHPLHAAECEEIFKASR